MERMSQYIYTPILIWELSGNNVVFFQDTLYIYCILRDCAENVSLLAWLGPVNISCPFLSMIIMMQKY